MFLEDKFNYNYFIGAQERVTGLHHSVEELSQLLVNTFSMKSFPQRCVQFRLQESFNLVENVVEQMKRLNNVEENRRQRDNVEEDHNVSMPVNNTSYQIGTHSSFKSHPR